MQALTSWITNIILFILLATVINLLLPSSGFQKYTKLVIGLLLMLIIVTPVFQILKVDVNKMFNSIRLSAASDDAGVENLIESKKKEIQASQRAYILEQMAVQMETEVKEELMEQYGVAIDQMHIETKNEEADPEADNIKTITVVMSAEEPEDEQAVAVVKEISIDTSTPIEKEPSKEATDITTYLAAKWGIDEKQMIVNLEEE
ncbi:stage III sporulation protein AF [Priestia flexa]|uniref:Stage III sporulation protein AF n=2 Tax=Priestia TaxID=2800373 RepID=A0A0V8JNG7_9BACI|nr:MULTISPECIES: stage III sporulation protein AF [Bacillaceae]AQX53789.1 stage III sporulation protein AF [Priestia flexa]KSU88460.1 stage III sporulation protein AF [Priestia veravalensis]KZB93150.1 stage III sporulation protein AF [Bacillus sp. VT 712]MBN8250365.1 stage III sporulation protein AF [Priestia flexa]MBN8432813.1 stage III sporulation protein AF [Priestia flexa]